MVVAAELCSSQRRYPIPPSDLNSFMALQTFQQAEND